VALISPERESALKKKMSTGSATVTALGVFSIAIERHAATGYRRFDRGSRAAAGEAPCDAAGANRRNLLLSDRSLLRLPTQAVAVRCAE
jgi:hypothetical protein